MEAAKIIRKIRKLKHKYEGECGNDMEMSCTVQGYDECKDVIIDLIKEETKIFIKGNNLGLNSIQKHFLITVINKIIFGNFQSVIELPDDLGEGLEEEYDINPEGFEMDYKEEIIALKNKLEL